MHLSIDNDDIVSDDPRKTQMVRAAAYFLLHAIGDINDNGEVLGLVPSVPMGTIVTPPKPPVVPSAGVDGLQSADFTWIVPTVPPPPASGDAAYASSRADSLSGTVPPPPPPPTYLVPPPPPVPTNTSEDSGDDDEGDAEPSNVVQGNFPQAVPPPPPPLPPAPGATMFTVPAAPGAAPVSAIVEVDNFGMPYDARIHQKSKNKMKNGAWKLIKGVDKTLVASVTAELAAKRGSLPPNGNTVPVPPSPPKPPTPPVPPSNGVGQSVPVPPAPPAGVVGAGDAYRNFVDKVIALNREGKVSSDKVNSLCQLHGASNIMTLASMPHLIADIERAVDAAALGLM